MSWKKEPQIKSDDLYIGCLNCSTAALTAHLQMEISVGFGAAYITKDGKEIYDGEQDYRLYGKAKKLRHFELMARKDPDHDWRFTKHGPMHGETFQRHDKNKWVCIESNQGFA